MAAVQEFPLRPEAQRMTIALGEIEYQFRFGWADSTEGGWFIDIADATGNALINGLPLTAGEDVLQQFAYLNIGGEIRIETDGNVLFEPTYDNLGSNGKVFFITP